MSGQFPLVSLTLAAIVAAGVAHAGFDDLLKSAGACSTRRPPRWEAPPGR